MIKLAYPKPYEFSIDMLWLSEQLEAGNAVSHRLSPKQLEELGGIEELTDHLRTGMQALFDMPITIEEIDLPDVGTQLIIRGAKPWEVN